MDKSFPFFHIGAFHLVHTHLGGREGSSLLYLSIAYYMQKGGGGGEGGGPDNIKLRTY